MWGKICPRSSFIFSQRQAKVDKSRLFDLLPRPQAYEFVAPRRRSLTQNEVLFTAATKSCHCDVLRPSLPRIPAAWRHAADPGVSSPSRRLEAKRRSAAMVQPHQTPIKHRGEAASRRLAPPASPRLQRESPAGLANTPPNKAWELLAELL